MNKLVNDAKGGVKKLFKSFFTSEQPEKDANEIILNSNLSDENKKELIRTLAELDNIGKNTFSYEKLEENNKEGKNKNSNKQEKAKISKNVDEKHYTRKDAGRGIGE